MQSYTITVQGVEISVQFDASKALFSLEKFGSVTVATAKSLASLVSRLKGAKDYSKVKASDSMLVLVNEILGTANNREQHLSAVQRLGHLINSRGKEEYIATLGICYTHVPTAKAKSSAMVRTTEKIDLDCDKEAMSTLISERMYDMLTSGKAGNLQIAITENGVVSVFGQCDGQKFQGHNASEPKTTVSAIAREAQAEGRYARILRVIKAGKTLSKPDAEFQAKYEARLALASA